MIGYYVHHVGRGHLTRATRVAHALDQPVVGLSSLPPPEAGAPYDDWVQLAWDDTAAEAAAPTAGGAVHWAPRGDAGLLARMSALAAWAERCRPNAVVVDVSVEVAVMLRLMGVPVVVVAMPGDRDDAAHQLGYRMAEAILAFWPRDLYDPPWLAQHRERTHFLGALSRFDGRPRSVPAPGARRTAVLLSGTGGEAPSVASGPLPPGWDGLVLGPAAAGGTWVDDLWPALCAADVVVTHGGQNALAEVAAARRPAIVVPHHRPHHEQFRTAEALAAGGIAHVVAGWPVAAEWPAALDRAIDVGADRWARWNRGDAAERAARVIAAVGAGWALSA